MSRKGYWRQIQREAGSRTERQTDRKRSTAERREGEAEQQRQCLFLLPPGSVATCFSTSQISILKGLSVA